MADLMPYAQKRSQMISTAFKGIVKGLIWDPLE